MVERRPRGEVTSGYNATIVVATISCEIARNGRRLKRSFAPPQKLDALPPLPIWTGHQDGTPGPLDSREGDGEGISPQGLDSRGEHRVGQEMRGIGELQVKIL